MLDYISKIENNAPMSPMGENMRAFERGEEVVEEMAKN